MILQHCPTTYKGKPHGCGYGPIHPTKAFLDYWGKCPRCSKAFVPYRKPRTAKATPRADGQGPIRCAVHGPDGQSYCQEKAVEGPYCQRHRYLNYEGGN